MAASLRRVVLLGVAAGVRGALADVSGYIGNRPHSDEYWEQRHEEWMRLNEIPPANPYDPGPSERTLEDTDWVTIGAGDEQLYTIDTMPCLELDRGFANGNAVSPNEQKLYLQLEMWEKTGTEARSGLVKEGDSPPRSGQADPMLLARRGMSKPRVTFESATPHWSPNTYVDLKSYQVVSPYHKQTLQFTRGELEKCWETPGTPECATFVLWQAMVYNVDHWMWSPLTFKFRATCLNEPPCPAPLAESRRGELSFPQCSGKGTCNSGICDCSSFYGGDGCGTHIIDLEQDKWHHNANMPVSGWDYYEISVEKDPTYDQTVVVELERSAGDVVLFLKQEKMGDNPGDVPTTQDYETFADTLGFRNRQNYHFRSERIVRNEKFYVAVYNNHIYLRESASYRLRARVVNTLSGVCGQDCGSQNQPPRGQCNPMEWSSRGEGFCSCYGGYGGERCEGRLMDLQLGTVVESTLERGQVEYFQIFIPKSKDFLDVSNLQIEFLKSAGHPVLFAKRSGYPSLSNHDFRLVFATDEHQSNYSQLTINRSDLEGGMYTVGVFNMDYEVHETCDYRLRLSLEGELNMIYGPYMTIILGVLVSVFLLLLAAICWRVAARRARNAQDMNAMSAVLNGIFGVVTRPGGPRNPQGLQQETIDSLPKHIYTEEDRDAAGEEHTCSVCLCDFEPGDVLRRIPGCSHEFHQDCVDVWLKNHTTCPMCRAEVSRGSVESQSQGNSQPSLPNTPELGPREIEMQVRISPAPARGGGAGDAARELEYP